MSYGTPIETYSMAGIYAIRDLGVYGVALLQPIEATAGPYGGEQVGRGER
jgi:hypothetical protein